MPEDTAPPNENARPPSARQVLLGLFILGQLAYLILSNVLGAVIWSLPQSSDQPRRFVQQIFPDFVPQQTDAKKTQGGEWADQVETVLRRWTQLTGQDQDWSLFAPGVSEETGFPAVLLLWDEPGVHDQGYMGMELTHDPKNGFNLPADWNPQQPGETNGLRTGTLPASWPPSENGIPRLELLLSDNEPRNLHAFFRFGKCRLRRYEGQFYLNQYPDEKESREQAAQRLTRSLDKLLRDYREPTLHYLKWRLHRWQREHPDQPAPKQVILFERYYRIRSPEEGHGWEGPFLLPMARWIPGETDPPRERVLEPFDFADERFVTR